MAQRVARLIILETGGRKKDRQTDRGEVEGRWILGGGQGRGNNKKINLLKANHLPLIRFIATQQFTTEKLYNLLQL